MVDKIQELLLENKALKDDLKKKQAILSSASCRIKLMQDELNALAHEIDDLRAEPYILKICCE